VLEPVPPQDLVRQVGRPHLDRKMTGNWTLQNRQNLTFTDLFSLDRSRSAGRICATSKKWREFGFVKRPQKCNFREFFL
jgi:hypothetical protein